MLSSLKKYSSLFRPVNPRTIANGFLELQRHSSDLTKPTPTDAAEKQANDSLIAAALNQIPKRLIEKTCTVWTPELDEKLKRVASESQFCSWRELTAKHFPGFSSARVYSRSKKISKAKGKWLDAEVDLLKQAVDKFGSQWSKVAAFVGTRSPDQCLEKWYYTKIPGNASLTWTKEDSDVLLQLVLECPGFRIVDGLPDSSDVDWLAVSEHMEKKSPVHCKHHFNSDPYTIGRVREKLDLTPLLQGPWSVEDSTRLISLIQKHSTDWQLISRSIGNRSAIQCERRWRTLQKVLRRKQEDEE